MNNLDTVPIEKLVEEIKNRSLGFICAYVLPDCPSVVRTEWKENQGLINRGLVSYMEQDLIEDTWSREKGDNDFT